MNCTCHSFLLTFFLYIDWIVAADFEKINNKNIDFQNSWCFRYIAIPDCIRVGTESKNVKEEFTVVFFVPACYW